MVHEWQSDDFRLGHDYPPKNIVASMLEKHIKSENTHEQEIALTHPGPTDEEVKRIKELLEGEKI